MPDGFMPPSKPDAGCTTAAGRARFQAYEELVSTLWNLEPSRDDLPRFDYSCDLRHLGVAVFGRTKAATHVARRTPSLVAEIGLDHIMVYYRQSGCGHLNTGGETVTLGAGDITFIDLSRPMWTTGSHVDAISIGFPRSMLAPLLRDPDSMHGTALRRETPLGRLAGAHLNALAAEIGAINPAEARAAAEATAALLAVCANGSPNGSHTGAEPAKLRARPALLITIRHHIEQSLSDPKIGTGAITRQFGLSRSTLYRLFQPFGGIDTYIRRRRLARAYQTLRTPAGRTGDYVYQVAQAWGFASDAAFSHAFRREFDVTPRQVALGLAQAPSPATPAENTLELSHYLRDLVFQAP